MENNKNNEIKKEEGIECDYAFDSEELMYFPGASCSFGAPPWRRKKKRKKEEMLKLAA